jgi:dihydroflavonol-4-reductase
VTDPRPTFLVTGATGFLGRHVLEAVRAEHPEARIVVLVRSAGSWSSQPWASALGRVEVVVGELLDTASWADDRRLAGLTGIFHLAAEVRHSRREVDEMIRTNVGGAVSMVEVAAKYGARVVFASTSGTVGCSTDAAYAPDEEAPHCDAVVARWPYYASKVRAEREARSAAERVGVELVVMRPPVLLGPGDHRFRSTSNVLRLLRGRLPLLFDGTIHYVDIRDVARAMVRAMTLAKPRPAYHLPGTTSGLDEFFRLVARTAGIEPRWRRIPARAVWAVARALELVGVRSHFIPDPVLVEMGIHHWGLTSSHSARDLGFRPRPPVETIADTVDWLRLNHPDLRTAAELQSIG